MARPKSPSTDPLIAALIAKLPAAGADWPEDQQRAWLDMMAMAFGTVYGGQVAAQLGVKSMPAPAAQPKPAPFRTGRQSEYPFYIDKEGFVRRGKDNARVTPSQINDMVFDMRGQDGDLRTIVWADGSTGLNGADLTIVGA